MNSNSSNFSKFTLALAVALTGQIGSVQAEYQINSIRGSLSTVPVAEVPAKAAEIVSQARPADREALAVEVVKLVVKHQPAVTVATVGLISAKSSEVAPTAAAAAAKLLPKQVKLIAKTAASAAPKQAAAIVKAICKVNPAHTEVAVAVAEGAPNSTVEILGALGELMPNYKTRLDVAMASFNGNPPSVAAVLYRANSATASGTRLADAGSSSGLATVTTPPTLRAPSVGPPYIPLSGTPSYVPSGGGVVPPGGRDYAAP